MKRPVMLIVGGMLVFVLGLILAGIVDTTASSSGAAASIGSFAGTRAINDVFPLIFRFGLITIGLGLMVGGGVGAYRQFRS